MTTTKHELIERVRLIVQEVQADNAETIVLDTDRGNV